SLTPAAPPLTVAVYCTPLVRAAAGVKVAMRPVGASSATVAAGTATMPGPVNVKVVDVMVSGSMRSPEGTVKVALTVAAGHTPAAAARGFVEPTETFAGGIGAAAVVKVHT